MINLLLFLACVIFTIRRLMTFLHVFQQEEYNGKRFIPWIIENKAFDKKMYVQLLPLALVASTILLKPKDKKVNASFRQEAVEKLEKLNPFIIGITGSFGKTSVKHILGHILENHAAFRAF